MTSTTPRADISGVHIGPAPSPSIYTSIIMATTLMEHPPRPSGVPITPLFVFGLSSFNTNMEVEHLLKTPDARAHMPTTSTDMKLNDAIPQALQAT